MKKMLLPDIHKVEKLMSFANIILIMTNLQVTKKEIFQLNFSSHFACLSTQDQVVKDSNQSGYAVKNYFFLFGTQALLLHHKLGMSTF